MSAPLVLILGGTRSGKSRYGQARATELAGNAPVTYVATAWRGDPELEARIEGHRRARPGDWPVVETGPDLAGTIAAIEPAAVVLLDGLTLWLSGTFEPELTTAEAFLDGPFEAALAAFRGRSGPTVVVSDEINLGLMPMDATARGFRDLIGSAHQRLAAEADEAWFMVAGLPLRLKGT